MNSKKEWTEERIMRRMVLALRHKQEGKMTKADKAFMRAYNAWKAFMKTQRVS